TSVTGVLQTKLNVAHEIFEVGGYHGELDGTFCMLCPEDRLDNVDELDTHISEWATAKGHLKKLRSDVSSDLLDLLKRLVIGGSGPGEATPETLSGSKLSTNVTDGTDHKERVSAPLRMIGGVVNGSGFR